MLQGSHVEIAITPDTTIEAFETEVAKLTGVPAIFQRLMFEGEVLEVLSLTVHARQACSPCFAAHR